MTRHDHRAPSRSLYFLLVFLLAAQCFAGCDSDSGGAGETTDTLEAPDAMSSSGDTQVLTDGDSDATADASDGLVGVELSGERCAASPDTARPDGWLSASHCKGEPPDYDLLFDDAVVHRLDIVIASETHDAMMADLEDILGSTGGPGGPPGSFSDQDPAWAPVTLKFNGQTWWEIGMRYKGNSSLNSAWRQGIKKLSFRLSFDKFEDDHPELDNQRFFGFKKMTFSNGFSDDSLIRDKVAADLFRAAGLPTARGSFARVYVDHGDGPVYFGLYTMIEDPSDELPDAQLADGSGTLYKPDGAAAAWTHFDAVDFEKKTNEDDPDFSAIEGAITALHGASRVSDPAAWRAGLEQRLDVPGFLRWLALNQSMVNWDTYGRMTHNYYVYDDPTSGLLIWMPWDLNEAMLNRGGMLAGNADEVMLDSTTDEWPLIRFLLDDDVYRAAYLDELRELQAGVFSQSEVSARFQAAHSLITPYVVGADGEATPYTFLTSDAAFTSALSTLESHVTDRHAAITEATR